jgi:hypothetical protein
VSLTDALPHRYDWDRRGQGDGPLAQQGRISQMAQIRTSLIAGSLALGLLASCATPTPAPVEKVTTAFDGIYEGNSVVDRANSAGACNNGGHAKLIVTNGHAIIDRQGDTREGWVTPDGSLKMTGTTGRGAAVLVVALDGVFKDGAFTGVSIFGTPPRCVYNWPSFKRV